MKKKSNPNNQYKMSPKTELKDVIDSYILMYGNDNKSDFFNMLVWNFHLKSDEVKLRMKRRWDDRNLDPIEPNSDDVE